MNQQELMELTQNLIDEYLQEGSLEGVAMLLADDVVAYSHQHSNYIRGNWQVRHFLQQQFDRLAPIKLNRCKMKFNITEEGASITSHMVLTCTKAEHRIFLNLTIMYQIPDEDCPLITGVYIYRDFRHESTYHSVTHGKHDMLMNEYLETYDELTGIYNKQTFYAKTKAMLQENPDRNFELLRVNVERFKVLNDLFGEHMGDNLLRYIGHFLRSLNLPFCVSGRLYADNFAICYEAGHGDSKRMINTLQIVVDSFAISHRTVLSFGLYRITDKSLPVSVMCDRANMALWRAKGNIRTPVCEYDENMRLQVLKEQKIVNAMSNAIEDKEFVVHMQPKYEVITGEIIGAEALVRWNSKEGGFIPPGDFIPVFENNGFVYEVDKFVWEETCRCLRRWLDEGKTVKPVSVNVSRIDLYEKKLVPFLTALRKIYDIPSRYLELEITESAYRENPEQIVEITQQLSDAGFVILMDDFGTGYSSLNMLKDMHVDILKLDINFLKNAYDSPRGRSILEAIMHIAEGLQMQTIAEGVETQEQVEFLKSIGCQFVQGFYYSKPLPVDEFEKLI